MSVLMLQRSGILRADTSLELLEDDNHLASFVDSQVVQTPVIATVFWFSRPHGDLHWPMTVNARVETRRPYESDIPKPD